MMESSERSLEVQETVALAGRLANWFRAAGVEQTDLSVDFADIIAAAKHADRLVKHMLTLNPQRPDEALQASNQLAQMHAWLFTEMKPHLEVLEQAWSALEQRLDELAPPEEE